MDLFQAIHSCLTGQYSDSESDSDSPFTSNTEKSPSNSHRTNAQQEENAAAAAAASSILHTLTTSEKSGSDLSQHLQDLVRDCGWTESLAKLVLDGLVKFLKSGAAMGAAIKEAFDKASAAAEDFVQRHPVYAAAIVVVVAIGILVLLAPWVVEALGFGELGPLAGEFFLGWWGRLLHAADMSVVGSWAAAWQAELGDVEANSFFAFLQRLGMVWGRK